MNGPIRMFLLLSPRTAKPHGQTRPGRGTRMGRSPDLARCDLKSVGHVRGMGLFHCKLETHIYCNHIYTTVWGGSPKRPPKPNIWPMIELLFSWATRHKESFPKAGPCPWGGVWWEVCLYF